MDNIKSPRSEPKKKDLEFYDEEQLKHLFRVLEDVTLNTSWQQWLDFD